MSKSKYKPYIVKCVKSGKILETYVYESPQFKKIGKDKANIKTGIKKSKKKCTDENYKREDKSVYKTKRMLKRLINANIGMYPETDKFITLTFKDFKSREQVLTDFRNFIRRLSDRYKGYKYIAVIERGTKSTKRLHLHCLFFGLPYVPREEFQAIWSYGGVDMRAIEDYNDVANYIMKYVKKTLEDGSFIPKGKKFYTHSKGMYEPEVYYLMAEELVNFMKDKNVQEMYRTSYSDEYRGDVEYIKLELEEEGRLSHGRI